MKRSFQAAFIVAAGVLSLASVCLAALPPTAGIDPKADEILHKVADQINSMQAFSFEAAVTAQMTTLKGTQQQTMKYSVAVHKPDRVAIVQKTTYESCTIICDGKSLYTYMPVLKKYVIEEAYKSIDKIPNWYVGQPGGGVGGLFCATGEEVYRSLRGTAQVSYKGVESVEGVPCHHLAFVSGAAYDHDLYIDARHKPLLRKSVVTHMMYRISASGQKSIVPEPGPPEFVTTYGPWMIDAAPPEDAFRIHPPADAKPAKSFDLNELMFGAAYSLRGKPAPSVVAPTLDGRALVLNRLKDHVVVLGFWNTRWTQGDGSLPDLARIAQQYRGKGVDVYAVNLGGQLEAVRKEASHMIGQIPVAVDTADNAGKVYGVKKLPHTVIIGKDGTVQFVQVFWGKGSDTRISAAIDALLAGKDLTKEDANDGAQSPATSPNRSPTAGGSAP